SELTAIGTYIQFWLPQVPLWLIEIVMLALLFGLNTLNSRFFGETEFWFAMIKVAAIIGMIVTAIILVAGNFHYSTVLSGKTVHDSASLSNIFDGFQLFPHGAWNFVGALQMVMFAFTSMEFIGMTAAETVNPNLFTNKHGQIGKFNQLSNKVRSKFQFIRPSRSFLIKKNLKMIF
ncbi:hypothetical protein AB0M39_42175, partial [Streptomyces sp. NPDC051907]